MKHFLHISDYNESEIWEILNLAKDLKEKFHSNEDYNPFKNKSLAMIFAKPSARTRVSLKPVLSGWGGMRFFLGPVI